VLPLFAAACHDAPVRKPVAQGVPVLRVLYRNDSETLLLTLPARRDGPALPAGCTTPLLIDL